MKYPVLRSFRDKHSGLLYVVGDEYEADGERGDNLQLRGFLGQVAKPTSTRKREKTEAPVSGDKVDE